jgi:hypothetical protein
LAPADSFPTARGHTLWSVHMPPPAAESAQWGSTIDDRPVIFIFTSVPKGDGGEGEERDPAAATAAAATPVYASVRRKVQRTRHSPARGVLSSRESWRIEYTFGFTSRVSYVALIPTYSIIYVPSREYPFPYHSNIFRELFSTYKVRPVLKRKKKKRKEEKLAKIFGRKSS